MRSLLYTAFKRTFLQTSNKATPSPWSRYAAVRSISTHIQPLCAGHSKWANIKHIKAAKDGQKAAMFLRMARQLRLAVQDGGSADPALNSQLKSVIEAALRQNMPMATIQQNLKKFNAAKTQLKKYRLDIRYKQKVFLVCNIYTDIFPQLKMEMATVLRKGGAALADASSMFEDFGLIQASVAKESLASIGDLEDAVTTDAIECGAEDVEVVDAQSGEINFICKAEILSGVQKLLENKGYIVDNTEHIFSPLKTVTLTAEERVPYEKFLGKLKEISGIEDVYDNIETEEK